MIIYAEIAGALISLGLCVVVGLLVALAVKRRRSLGWALGSGLATTGLGVMVVGAVCLLMLWAGRREPERAPRMRSENAASPRPAPPKEDASEPDPSGSPNDAELLRRLVGSSDGHFTNSSGAGLTATVHVRAELQVNGQPGLLALFLITRPDAPAGGALPIAGLRSVGALLAYRSGDGWAYFEPQPALVSADTADSFDVSHLSEFDLENGQKALKWTLRSSDQATGETRERTLLVAPGPVGLEVLLDVETDYARKGQDVYGRPVCDMRRGRLETTDGSETGSPGLALVTRVSTCEMRLEGTFVQFYRRAAGRDTYEPGGKMSDAPGAPDQAGWIIEAAEPQTAYDDGAFGRTYLCTNGVAIRQEGVVSETSTQPQGKIWTGQWSQARAYVTITWSREASWAPGAPAPVIGKPERPTQVWNLLDPFWINEVSSWISRDDRPCMDILGGKPPYTGFPGGWSVSTTAPLNDAELAKRSHEEILEALAMIRAQRGATLDEVDVARLRTNSVWHRDLVSDEQAMDLMTPMEQAVVDRLEAALITADPVEQELLAVLNAIQRAERRRPEGPYLSVAIAPRSSNALTVETVPWVAGEDWQKLGFSYPAPVRGSYWVDADPGGKDYVAHGVALGEHGPVEYTATESRAPQRVP